MYKRKHLITILAIAIACMVGTACSTKKNTAGTRFYHSITARFNTLYNGQLAFTDGVEAQEKGHKDNYTELLPMYISTVRTTAGLGKANYQTTIEKSEKAIKTHSIKRRPTVTSGKRLTPKEKEFLARKEFNPYLYKAWFMMGEAQFNQGEFIEAASTFNYIIRLYSTQPDIVCMARAWLARCYVALEWSYDAEDVLQKMKRDSITIEGRREMENTMAAYYVQTGQYDEATTYLERTIKTTRGKNKKARLNFLLGQLYHETGNNTKAYKAFSRVIKANPNYELYFNARIKQTEVMSHGQHKAMVKKLQRMAKDETNKNYLDQVYYAIGNIYLSVGDTAKCVGAWEKGAEESTQNGIAKSVLLLHLSQLYWQRENYIDAARTYTACVAILDKEHDDYKESEHRAKILTEVEPHLSAVKLQDSLQVLAKLPEKEYLAAIDRVIEALKKKEKEQARKEGAAEGVTPAGGTTPATPSATTPAAGGRGGRGSWYFYNPQTVMRGKQEFQRVWGNRKNEDNWRRSNKTVAAGNDFDEYNYDDAPTDSLGGDFAGTEETDPEQALKDSLANDPHHREYYLKQIPFTEEQLEASNATLADGLYNSGIMEMEKIENFPLAEKTLMRLMADFPEYEHMDDVYYHLFLLYGRFENDQMAEYYRQQLVSKYPDAKSTKLITNPNYLAIARNGKHMEDSLYAATHEAYQASEYAEVMKNYQFGTENFPQGKNRARMMFIHAMSNLYTGQRDSFLVNLKQLIQDYPKEEVTEMAQYIVKGLQEGRLLADGKMDASSIWSRRALGESADSTAAGQELKEERFGDFAFVLAYPTNSLDEDQLLFEMARYNFSSYMVRNFDIETSDNQGISLMVIKGFQSYDEVHAYAQQLYSDHRMSTLLEGIRTLLISEENLKLVGTSFSFDDYRDFYDEKFAPLNVPEDLILDEPTDIEQQDPEDILDSEQGTETDEGTGTSPATYDDFPYGF